MTWESRAAAGARIMLTIAGIVVASVLGLKILVLLLEAGVTFHPPGATGITPASVGLPFEDVWIESSDQVRIHGWFIPGMPGSAVPGTRRTLIAFHGNAENIETDLFLARLTRAAGHDLLLVDYRGYGSSAGRPSERGIYRDGESAYRYVRDTRRTAPRRIVLWGRSIGAAVAVDVAARAEVGGLVLESPFTSAQDLLREGGHWLLYGLSLFGTYRFDSIGKIGEVRSPILVIHGTADEVAPFVLGRRLFERAPGKREFLAIEGGGHNDLWALRPEILWAGIARFLGNLPPDAAGL